VFQKKSITIFTFFTSFLYPLLPISALPLAWPVFHSCPSLFRCLLVVQWDFCLGFIPVHALYLSQCNPLHCTSSPFPHPVLFHFILFLHDVTYFFIIRYLSFLRFLLPWSPLPVPLWDTCSVCVCVCVCVWIYIYIYMILLVICVGPIFHVWEKICSPWLSEPG
jgi:hypothetical protein